MKFRTARIVAPLGKLVGPLEQTRHAKAAGRGLVGSGAFTRVRAGRATGVIRRIHACAIAIKNLVAIAGSPTVDTPRAPQPASSRKRANRRVARTDRTFDATVVDDGPKRGSQHPPDRPANMPPTTMWPTGIHVAPRLVVLEHEPGLGRC